MPWVELMLILFDTGVGMRMKMSNMSLPGSFMLHYRAPAVATNWEQFKSVEEQGGTIAVCGRNGCFGEFIQYWPFLEPPSTTIHLVNTHLSLDYCRWWERSLMTDDFDKSRPLPDFRIRSKEMFSLDAHFEGMPNVKLWLKHLHN